MTINSIVLYIHLLVALMIIVLVLVQRGKGAEAGTGFGSGASGTVFGARGSSNFFSRATGVLATMFFMTSLSLAYLAGQTTAPTSLLEEESVLGSVPEPGAFEPESFAVPSELPELPSLPVVEEPPADEPAQP